MVVEGGVDLIQTNEKSVMLYQRSGPGGNKVGCWEEKESEPLREVDQRSILSGVMKRWYLSQVPAVSLVLAWYRSRRKSVRKRHSRRDARQNLIAPVSSTLFTPGRFSCFL